MQKIVVIGSHGQLGSELKDLSVQYPNYIFYFFDREHLDIVQEEAVKAKIKELQPYFLINCAAYTAVDKAETEQEICYAINAEAVKYLAKACKENNTKFIHISTDYVFDGTATTPYTEESPTNPQSVYGLSKLQGEHVAVEQHSESVIIRTAWVYSFYGANFVKTMMRLMQSRPEIGVVADQQGSPTYAADLAESIMNIIEAETWQPGVYHYTNEGTITWFEFAQAIKEIAGLECNVNPISTDQYPTPAKRPQYSVLDKSKIKATYKVELKPWKESLQQCIQKLKL